MCETAVCIPSCKNGGRCIRPDTCSCRPGYTGHYCQNAVCAYPCENGGTCTSPNFCTCSKGYTGPSCEQGICLLPCLNGGKCSAPDVCTCLSGYKGKLCEQAICNPECKNGGLCVAPDTCDCKAGYLGLRCETGGRPSSFLIPVKHYVDESDGKPFSWYDEPVTSSFGKVCFIKVRLIDAALETLVSSNSFNNNGNTYGNFTVGGIDESYHSNGSDRTACLEFRCPSAAGIHVRISISTSRQTCNVTQVSKLSYSTYTDVLNNEGVDIVLEPDNDYGSYLGIYVAHGLRQPSLYSGRKRCLCGQSLISDEIVPARGAAVTYRCSD